MFPTTIIYSDGIGLLIDFYYMGLEKTLRSVGWFFQVLYFITRVSILREGQTDPNVTLSSALVHQVL